MNSKTLSEQIQNILAEHLRLEDPEAKIGVKPDSLGWLTLRIITSCFENKPLFEREEKIDRILEGMDYNLGKYPIAKYELLTPQEADQEYVQLPLPLWSDILIAPEPDQAFFLEAEELSKTPTVVSFYSFKGGVGRSTALGLVAGILASRNRRVVVVDFDLEAPGISILFKSDLENYGGESYGVLDYLHQRYLTPDQNIPKIEDCVQAVNLSSRGELFLVPAGEYNENYIHRLADFDRKTLQVFYHREKNPVKKLIEDIKEYLTPDIILIDARPGFDDTSAIVLFDLSDTAIICFSPTDQSFTGLRWVVQAAKRQRDYTGKPDLRFLLTPLPTVTSDQKQIWISRVENWIEDNWKLPSGITVEELYYEAYYNPQITTLSSLVNDVPKAILDSYIAIADVIDSSLPDLPPPEIANLRHSLEISEGGQEKPSEVRDLSTKQSISAKRQKILDELNFEAVTAQELDPKKIPDIFHRTEDFSKFILNKNWLIRGAKGTGKSLLFRLFVEQSEQAKKTASNYANLENVSFVAAHGKSGLQKTILERSDLESYEREMGENNWLEFWINYALLQMIEKIPELRSLPALDQELVDLCSQNSPPHSALVSWLVKRAKSTQAGTKATDELRTIDRWLQENKQVIWLLYDELDAGFGEKYDRRKRALEALLSWWLEIGTSLKQIVPKIFLREDIWKNELNFTNKGHYNGRSLQLRWEEADLWKLLLRRTLTSSKTLRTYMQDTLGVTESNLDTFELGQLRKTLYPLWGERMGRNKKAYTYNWVRTRITDGQGNSFPRSLILLLQKAVEDEKSYSSEYSSERLLRPKVLTDALLFVSEQRVEEVQNEYPELKEYLDKLQGKYSPIDADQLAEIWGINDVGKLTFCIQQMVEAGIFTERSRPKDSPPLLYTVVELYLYGLNMKRKGPS